MKAYLLASVSPIPLWFRLEPITTKRLAKIMVVAARYLPVQVPLSVAKDAA